VHTCRLETISTEDVAAHRKVRFWNESVSALVSAAAAEPVDTGTFAGLLRRLELPQLRFAEILGGASSVRRIASPQRAHSFVLNVMLSGEIVCRSGGVKMEISAGDLCLFSSQTPVDMFIPRPATLLAMVVSREHLSRYIACPEAVSSVVVSGASGPGALASRFLRDFWTRAEHELDSQLAARFGELALQTVIGAYAGTPEARPERASVLIQHRMRIRAYIEEHLHDPELTPGSVAEALRMTRGYLHRLFSGDSESPARYILRRRLEECHRALGDPMQVGRSVTTIAFEHGFNSLPHFCRVFRAQYGVTPREHQLRAAMSAGRTAN
jgi:AraC-like DNA-binding protein